LIYEFSKVLQRNKTERKLQYIYIDMVKDPITEKEKNLDPIIILGIRVASIFFFNLPSSELRALFSVDQLQLFTFQAIMDVIYKKLKEPLSLIIHIDEFQAATEHNKSPTEMQISMLTYTAGIGQKNNIFVFPILSGTAPSKVYRSLYFSKFSCIFLELTRLSPSQSEDIIHKLLQSSREELYSLLMSCQHSKIMFNQSIGDMGGLPRFLELFYDGCKNLKIKVNLNTMLNDLLEYVLNKIPVLYDIKIWEKFLGGKEGITELLYLSFTNTKVNYGTRLNGLTIKDVKESGILIATPVDMTTKDANNILPENKLQSELFIIDMPFILLRLLNKIIHLIEDHFLNSFAISKWSRFESQTAIILNLRVNLLVQKKRTTAKLKELYPNALADPSVLEKEVSLAPIKEHLHAFQQTKNDHIVKSYSPKSINIENGIYPISLLDGSFIVNNVDKAPSFDWCYCHPATTELPAILEVHQSKSSDQIRKGISPKTEVYWNEIMNEYKKVHDKKHSEWYSSNGLEEIMVFETNKPLRKSHFEQCVSLISGTEITTTSKVGRPQQKITDFPKNLIIICQQNVSSVIPQCFLHRGWIIEKSIEEITNNKTDNETMDIDNEETDERVIEEEKKDICELCQKQVSVDDGLYCNQCGKGYHVSCKKLSFVPHYWSCCENKKKKRMS